MRILVLAPTAPMPMNSGTRIRQSCLLQALSARHAVKLVYFQDDTDATAAQAALASWRVASVPVDPCTKERFAPNGGHSRSDEPWLVRGEYSPVFAEAVRRAVQDEAPDVVVVARLILLRYVENLVAPQRVVVDLDDIESIRVARQLSLEPWSMRRLRRYADWWRLRQWEGRASTCAVSTVCSAVDVKRLARRGWRQVVAISNSVDVNVLRPLPEPEGAPPTLIFCGLLSYGPNSDAMIWFLREIWPSIRKQLGQARMLVIGRQPMQALTALHGRDGIVVQGPVEQVEPWYAQSHAAIAPIRAGSGTRLKLLEAFAYSRPAVSTTMGAEGLDVSDGRNIMLADTPSAFADACVQLLRSRPMRQAMGAAARQLVEARYSWAAIEEQWRQTVEAVAQQRAAS